MKINSGIIGIRQQTHGKKFNFVDPYSITQSTQVTEPSERSHLKMGRVS